VLPEAVLNVVVGESLAPDLLISSTVLWACAVERTWKVADKGHMCLRAGDKYALVMKFVDHVFDDQVIDQLTVQIILPEGAR